MSSDPTQWPPPGQSLPPHQWAPPPWPPPASAHPRRRRRRVGGVVVLIATVLIGGGLLTAAGATFVTTVDDFARAPVGCTTTIEVDRASTYLVFVETAGTLPEVGGDCPAGGAFDFEGDAPDVAVRIVSADGVDVALRPVGGRSYDLGTSRGEQVATARFPAAGEYRITATAPVTGLAVAVGRDPYVVAAPWALGAGAVGLVGVPVAVVLLVGGRRRVRAGA
ncbi:MAG: hypothetical protein ACKOA2_01090 [Ilumatobacteraceae bacterium]